MHRLLDLKLKDCKLGLSLTLLYICLVLEKGTLH